MRHMRKSLAMILSLVMIFSLMTGVGAPRVQASVGSSGYQLQVTAINLCGGYVSDSYQVTEYDTDVLYIPMGETHYYIFDNITWNTSNSLTSGSYKWSLPTWSIADTTVASIGYTSALSEYSSSPTGIRIVPKKVGETTVTWTATDGTGKTDSIKICVCDKLTDLSSTSVFQEKGMTIEIAKGGTYQLSTKELAVTYTSLDSSVATVSNTGLIQAVGAVGSTAKINLLAKQTNTPVEYYCTVKIVDSGSSQDIPVTGLSLSPTTLTLSEGATGQLTATVTPSNATNKTVTWTSGNTGVATVDANGKVTAKKAGKAVITATAGTYSKTCTVTVSETPEITGVTLSKTSTTLEEGAVETITATVASKGEIDTSVVWTTSNASVATVNNGTITAVASGTATITATSKANSQKSASCTVTVTKKQIAVTGLTLSPTTLTLYVGGTGQLTATVTPDNATDKTVTWTSGNTGVATVDTSGKVTAVKAGEAVITATTGNYTKTCTVTVKEIPEITGITLSKSSTTIEEGASETITAYVSSKGEIDTSVVWTTSNASVATVNNGTITAVVPGTATITATSKANSQKSASCTVTVTKKKVLVTGLTLKPESISLDARDDDKKTAIIETAIAPTDATDPSLTWSSSNEQVATVAGGVVTAVGGGTATITATTNDGSNISKTCTVTVVTPVTEISLDESNITLDKNETKKITATVKPVVANNKAMTVESKDTNIATVEKNDDGSYTVTGLSAGTTQVVFTSLDDSTVTKILVVKVNPTLVSSITVSGSTSARRGDMWQLTAQVLPEDADDKSITWESSNDVVSITETGYVTARKEGTATIHVASKDGGASTDYVITVKPTYVTSISVTAQYGITTLKKGETLQLTASIIPTSATNKSVLWSSSDESLVSVNPTTGLVEVMADNITNTKVTITATAQDGSGKTGSITLTVEPTPVESFVLNGGSVGVGNTLQLQATNFTPANATNKTITSWTSSNGSVATVNDAGLVTGVAAGTTYITATCADGKTATATVTVVSNVISVTDFSVNLTEVTKTVGESFSVTAEVNPANATNKTLTWSITEGQDVLLADLTQNLLPAFTAIKPGTAKITVCAASNVDLGTKTILVTVLPKYVTAISVTGDNEGNVKQGDSVQLSAALTPADATYSNVIWSSSDETLATVDAFGYVRIANTGSLEEKTVTITARAGDGSASHAAVSQTYTLQIDAAGPSTVNVSNVTIDGAASKSVLLGASAFDITAQVAPENATNKNVKWEIISGTSVVRIVSNGTSCTVTPIGVGEAVIQVSSEANSSKYATFTVTVLNEATHEHLYTASEKIFQPATCTQPEITWYYCLCGEHTAVNTAPALGHDYGDTVVPPTLEAQGYTVHTCKRTGCGHSYTDSYVDKLTPHVHAYTVRSEVIQQADCVNPQITRYYCGCNAYVDQQTADALGHSYSDTVVAPTTASEGYTKHTCTRCGDTYTDSYVPKKTASVSKPKKATIKTVKSKKKGTIVVTWKKDTKVSGYEITLATDSKFKKNKKTVLVKSYKTTSATVKKLKSKKTYYVRIRSYKTVKGKKVYGSYSKVKKLKTK